MQDKKPTALTIAKYFLSVSDREEGELISNLKLQKLLYYAQGYYVGLNGASNPLYEDTIYAWKHGPVVDTVFHHYKKCGKNALPDEKCPKNLSEDHISFLNEIYRSYGRFSAWVLRDMTHREEPWLEHYKPNVKNITIPLEDLEKFFKDKIELV